MSVNAVRMPAAEATTTTSSQSTSSQNVTAHAGAYGSALSECVARTVRRYLADIGDTECAEGLHALVLREVEMPLLREVMAFHEGNQSRAASALGINRATLRKKLAAQGRRLPILGSDDDTANRQYTKEFALARDRLRGRAHGLEYAEYFHYVPRDESDIEDYVEKHAVSL